MNRKNYVASNKSSLSAKSLSIKLQKEKKLEENRSYSRNFLVANRKMKRDEKLDEKRNAGFTSSNGENFEKAHTTTTKEELHERLNQYLKEKEEKKHETKLAMAKRPPFRAGSIKSKIPMKVDFGCKSFEQTPNKIKSQPTPVKSKKSSKHSESIVNSANVSLVSKLTKAKEALTGDQTPRASKTDVILVPKTPNDPLNEELIRETAQCAETFPVKNILLPILQKTRPKIPRASRRLPTKRSSTDVEKKNEIVFEKDLHDGNSVVVDKNAKDPFVSVENDVQKINELSAFDEIEPSPSSSNTDEVQPFIVKENAVCTSIEQEDVSEHISKPDLNSGIVDRAYSSIRRSSRSNIFRGSFNETKLSRTSIALNNSFLSSTKDDSFAKFLQPNGNDDSATADETATQNETRYSLDFSLDSLEGETAASKSSETFLTANQETPVSDEKLSSNRKRRQTMTPGELNIQLTKAPEICFDNPVDVPNSILKSVEHHSVRKSVRFNLAAKQRDSLNVQSSTPLEVEEKTMLTDNAGFTPCRKLDASDFSNTPNNVSSENVATAVSITHENTENIEMDKKPTTPSRRSTRKKSADFHVLHGSETHLLSPFLRTRRSVYQIKENLIEF